MRSQENRRNLDKRNVTGRQSDSRRTDGRNHRWEAAGTLAVLVALCGCGGGGGGNSGSGGSTTPTITSVTVSCASPTVPTGQTNQCTAAASGTGNYNPALTWSVNGTSGGNSSVGTVSASGLYSAPSAVPTPYTVSVTATSAADSTKLASFSLIVAGTIATVTQPITAASGGTITLPDGSSVTIAAGALPADQSVTLSEVSWLSQQPPNTSVTSAGPALELAFSIPIQPPAASAVPAHRPLDVAPAIASSTTPAAFSFSINVAKNNVSGLSGSVPFVDFVDTSNNNLFTGASGNYDSTVPVVNASIESDAWGVLTSWSNKITGMVVGAFTFTSNAFKSISVPRQLSLAINASDPTQDSWGLYSPSSNTCPTGRTLLVVHGMLSDVEDGFSTGSKDAQGVIQALLKNAGYDSALGFDYDWTQGIGASGSQLADFLNSLFAQCPSTSLDIEAHSEGVPVSLSALTKLNATQLKAITHVIALGGPIMGTPVANDQRVLGALLLNLPTVPLFSGMELKSPLDLFGRPFTTDLTVDSSALSQVRSSLSGPSIKGQPQIFVVAGNNQEANTSFPAGWIMFWSGEIMTLEGYPASDGFIPLTSALPLQPGVDPGSELEVHPLPPFPTDHLDLTSNGDIVAAVGKQVNNGFAPPSLTLSATPSCSDDLVCQGPPGTVFALDGNGYNTTTVIHGYELDGFGNVYEHDFPTSNGSLGASAWQDPTACSAAPASVMFFAQDSVTQLASNATIAETTSDSCVAPPVVTISPKTAQIPVNGVQQFVASVGNTTNGAVTWSVNGIAGGDAAVGTISSAGLYTAPVTVPNPAAVTVTATSQADPSASASATVTIGSYALKDIYSFTSLGDGAAPSAPLVQGKDGYFYGTTQLGGTYGYGTVFKSDSAGNITTLHSFTGADGANPTTTPLVLGSDGKFYGATENDGAYTGSDTGTIFTIDSTGNFTLLYSFTGGNDGGAPFGLVQAGDGLLFGTTFNGGTSNNGTIFKMSLTGQITTLYSFTGGSDGSGPVGLIFGSDGLFYGGTQNGGDASCADGPGTGCGTLFKVDGNGDLQVLHTFTGQDGAQIDEPLLQSPLDGNFYGTTVFGGNSACAVSTYTGCGTIFKIDSSGTFTLLHAFSGGAEGGVPFSSLIQASDGDFYGTATAGGDPSCSVIAANENFPTYIGCGTVFKMDSFGNVNALYSFKGSPNDGSNPFSALLTGSDGYFYGTTRWGGTATACPYTNNGGCGTFYKVAGPGGPLTQIAVSHVPAAAIPTSLLPPTTGHKATTQLLRRGDILLPSTTRPTPLTGVKRPH